MSDNGCLEFATTTPEKQVELVDKFIYEMIDLENVKN
jgi:hypothetical protein